MAGMAIAAWVVVRSKVPGRMIVDQLSFLPMVIPGLVLGLALSFVYLRSPIPIYRHHLHPADRLCDPVHAVRDAVRGHVHAADRGGAEESAQVSGAAGGRRFRRVLVAAAHTRPDGGLDLHLRGLLP